MNHLTRLSIILLLLCIPAAQAFAGFDNGLIKGTVLTSDGKPAEGVTIILKGTKKTAATALKNFGLGAGGNYVSDAYWDAANTFIIPSYTVVNATVFYDQPKWRLGLKVNNIGNEQYWNANGYAQTPRQWIGNVTFKF